jgi:Protein of unknown function with PCYCGC motif
MLRTYRWLPFLVLCAVLIGTLAGCGSSAASTSAHDLAMAPMSDMSAEVQSAPLVTRQAYQFAVANPEVMKNIPCYCGCGAMGHTSNYSCYVAGLDAKGSVKFETHALGCSICVDITQDAMRLLRQGKDVQAIRAYVDQTYSRYGPSNMQ